MPTRYAGDYFGISLADEDQTSSKLLKYFPELKGRGLVDDAPKSSSDKGESAVTAGGYKVPPSFAGFKTYRR